MRTAEQYLDKFLPKNLGARDAVIAAINEARKDTIDECVNLLNPGSSERMIKQMLLLKKLVK